MNKRRDLIGEYFHSLWLTGDKREFYFLIDHGKSFPVIYPVRHDEADGQFGFEKIMTECNFNFTRSNNSERERPSIFRQIKDLISWLIIIPKNRATWKTRTEKASLQKFSNLRISEEELKYLKEKARGLNTNLNGLLIKSLNEACLPYYENSKNAWWLLPVALPDSQRQGSGNNISFLDLYITPTMTSVEVGNQLTQKLKSGRYWGHYLAFKLLHLTSPWLLAKFLPPFFSKFQRTVTYSHLGKWTVNGIGPGQLEVIAPAFSLSPLFLVLIEINDELIISLSQQSHLDIPIDNITKQWKEFLLSNL